MPKKLNAEKLVSVTIRVTQQQARDLDLLATKGRYGSSRPDVIKYFMIRELDRFDEGRRLNSDEGAGT
jgi:Arc/MetJ-type ribon-helix-helix transcriptional regulator